MTYSSFWFGKESDTPLPPGPIDIGNSLRFRGSQVLQKTTPNVQPNNSTPGTFSFWVKKSTLNTEQTLYYPDSSQWIAAFLTTNLLGAR